MRSLLIWFACIISCLCAKKKLQQSDFPDSSSSNDRTDFFTSDYMAAFQRAHAARITLDATRARYQFPLTRRQQYLLEVLAGDTSEIRSFEWPYEHVEYLCRVAIRRHCSWNDAMFLLDRLYGKRYSGSDHQSTEDQWLRPTRIIKQHKHKRQQKECIRLKSAPSAAEFLYYYVSRAVPFVLEGGASKWPAITKWRNTSYLFEQLRSERVRIYASLDRDFEKVQRRDSVLDLLSKHDIPYLETDFHEEEDLLVRPAETEVTFEQYLHLSGLSVGTSNSNDRYANEEGAVFYLQKHDLRRWSHISAITEDISPSLLNRSSFAHMLALEHYLLWMAVRGSSGDDNLITVYAINLNNAH